jgi:hypothetical protein
MYTHHCAFLLRARIACTFSALFFSTTFYAQVPATDPVALAKYDTNRNGRLDADEVAAMEAAKGTGVPANAVVSATPAGNSGRR